MDTKTPGMCDICGRPGHIHITELRDGEKFSQSFCVDHAPDEIRDQMPFGPHRTAAEEAAFLRQQLAKLLEQVPDPTQRAEMEADLKRLIADIEAGRRQRTGGRECFRMRKKTISILLSVLAAIGAAWLTAFLYFDSIFSFEAKPRWKIELESVVLFALPAIIGILVLFCVYRVLQRSAVHEPSMMCENCGYDCRVTPDRCPECGMIRTR